MSDEAKELTLEGNCHCGAFKYTATFPGPITSARQCSCSLCSRKGYLWVTAKPDGVKIHRGDEELKSYSFNDAKFQHKFCGKCGTSVYGQMNSDGVEIVVWNLRTMYEFRYWDIDITTFDGASIVPPAYINPTLPESELKHDGELCIYEGGCHCGQVKLEVRTKHLVGEGVMECNCSLCGGNGIMWIYPPTSNVTVTTTSKTSLTTYPFGRRKQYHEKFCSNCGCFLVNENLDDPDSVCVNVRMLKGIQLADMKVNKFDGAKSKPKYECPE